MQPYVFLSYVRENRRAVDHLKRDLENAGIHVWIDRRDIAAGQDWDREIRTAIERSTFFLACFSVKSASRERSNMNVELLIAIEELQRRAPDQDWLIPIKLSRCRIPNYMLGGARPMSNVQYVELFRAWKSNVQLLIARLRTELQRRTLPGPNAPATSKPSDNNASPLAKPSVDMASSGQQFQVPGGPLAATVSPYVERSQDAVIRDTLRGTGFAMLVSGPAQSGKSTTLALLQRRAREAGIETAWFDPAPRSIRPRATAGLEDDGEAIQTVSQLLQAAWGLGSGRKRTLTNMAMLTNWMLQELTPRDATPRLLILDDLAALGSAAAERWLTMFVRPMVNQRATHGLNISLAVGLSDQFGAHYARQLLHISSVVHWRPRITMDWLSSAEVASVVQASERAQLSRAQGEVSADVLFSMFRGQPYLTHAAIFDAEFYYAMREWSANPSTQTATAIRRFQWYRRHLGAIRRAILGPTYEITAESRQLVSSLAHAAEDPLDADHHLFLSAARLLDDTGKLRLGIYQLIAEDLLFAAGDAAASR